MSRSSSDGLVAAVIATVSPSQPSPLVIQTMWTTWRSAACWPGLNSAWAITCARCATGPSRGGAARRGCAARRARPGTRGARRPCRAGATRRRARHEPGVRQTGQRMGHRRALGPDELAEQAMGERQGEADAAGSTFPQRAARCHSSSASRTSRRGWRGDRRAGRRGRRRAWRHAAAGRGGSAATGGCARRRPRRARRRASGTSACQLAVACSSSSAPRSHGLSRSPGADELGGRAVADLDVDARSCRRAAAARGRRARRANHRARIAVADPDLEHDHGRHLADDHAHADVERLREVGIGVEQVAVRRRGRRLSRSTCCSRSVGDHDARVVSHPPPRPVAPSVRSGSRTSG